MITVNVKESFVWYDIVATKGDIIELDEGLFDRLLRAGYIEKAEKPKRKEMFEPIIEAKDDQNELSSENSGDSKPTDDSVGKNASKGRADRRNK